MKKINVNGKEYEVCKETVIYPSGSPSIRNKLEIHMKETEDFKYEDFEKLFSEGSIPESLKILGYSDDNNELISETECKYYTEILNISKKRIDIVEPSTGEVSSEMHFVVELEQLLYIERLALLIINSEEAK